RSKYAIEDVAAGTSDASPASDQNCQLVEPVATVPSPPPSPGRSGTSLAAEAVHLASSLDVSRAAWNKPPPVRIVSASENNAGGLHDTAIPSIFDFVHRGSRLLHPAHETKLGAAGGASSSKSTNQTSSVPTDTSRPSSMLDNPGWFLLLVLLSSVDLKRSVSTTYIAAFPTTKYTVLTPGAE
ncbi:unnamed protein product, partial [Dibothriocephalus latus]